MRAITKLFLRGLAVVLPITLSLYLLWWLGSTTEALLGPLLSKLVPGVRYVPGMGLAAGLGLVIAVGALMKAVLVRELHRAVERLIRHVPLLKTVYGSIKDVLSFVTGDPAASGVGRVVSVTFPEGGCTLIGFLTRESAAELTGRDEDAERVAVYLPMSYQLGGYMVLVPRAQVTPLAMSVEDAIGLTLTAGMSRGEED